MVVERSVRVEPAQARRPPELEQDAVAFEKRERAVHGIQRHGRHPLPQGFVNVLGGWMAPVAGDLSEDLDALRRSAQATRPAQVPETLDEFCIARCGGYHRAFLQILLS
jgi:hypothetical protein